jgi:hypothetical protein
MKAEEEINVFVNGVLHYFNTSVQQVAECGTPYLNCCSSVLPVSAVMEEVPAVTVCVTSSK